MNIRVFDNEAQAGEAAATLITAQVLRKPESVIGLATGSTPLDTYHHLIKLTQKKILDWSRVTTFNLDEYVGLPADHPQSYLEFMKNKLFNQINIRPEAINIPDGMADDIAAECLSYERKIRQAGGIDLQLLGIGRNGHIGFNEPNTVFATRTHCAELTEDTIAANARFFSNAADVPRKAVSMGIGTIMRSWQIVLLATGSNKARAVAAMVQGDVDPQCQASILQTHSNVTILLDRAAAVALSR
jgi:glucosamine-6-phosphate deaminase